MQYAIEMYFDEKTEVRLWDLARGVADSGISYGFIKWKSRPHITLACFSDVDEELCAVKLRAFAEKHDRIPAYIGSVGMFTDTGVVFASPIMTGAMYDLQRELHECMSGFDTKGWEWYLPNRWVPHCGLAMTQDDPRESFFRASDLILHEFEKLAGEYVSVGLVKITCPVQELRTFRFGSGCETSEK